jgi:hypothetical protein
MAKCDICGADTNRYVLDVPVCATCDKHLGNDLIRFLVEKQRNQALQTTPSAKRNGKVPRAALGNEKDPESAV